jgi:O-antigen/teichoic acid export membrane protein
MTSTTAQKTPAKKKQARGRHRRADTGTSRLNCVFGRESLFHNTFSLIINLALGAVCGYGGLLLLTRIFSVQVVGLSATAASASALIVSIMQFGINYSLPRFLPLSKNRSALINTVLTLIAIATLLGAATYLSLPIARKLFILGGWLFGLVFLLGACVQAGESAFETILIADRSSSTVAKGNVAPNIIKLIAPTVLVALGALGAYVSRIIADIAGFCIFGILLARRGHRFRPAVNIAATRDLSRFSVGMYIASLLGSLPLMILPIIILARFGPRQSAYWSIAITIATLLYQLPGAVAQALFPEAASRPSDRRYLMRRSSALILGVVIPVLAIAYVAAPVVLAFFGRSYGMQSLAILRWLIIAGFITILNYVSGAVLFLGKKSLAISVVNVVNAVIVLGMAGLWAHSSRDVAVSWVIGDVANTVLFAAFAFHAIRQVRGRWEALGDPHAELSGSTTESPASAMKAQQHGIEVLIRLAEAQRTGQLPGWSTGPSYRSRLVRSRYQGVKRWS